MDSLRMVKSGMVTASALRRMNEIDASIRIYNSIRPIAEKNLYTQELSVILNSVLILLRACWLPQRRFF